MDIEVTIHAYADTTGTKLAMIRSLANYTRESGALTEEHITIVVTLLEEACATGTYLIVSPQFAVTARAD